MNIKTIWCGVSCVALIVGLTACSNNTPEPEPPAPAGQQELASVQMLPAHQVAATGGKVVEKQDASVYTYVRLDNGTGNQIWAAVPKTQLEIGEEITLMGGSVMNDFESKTLNRTFKSIIFATGVIRASEGKAPQTPGGPAGGLSDTAQSSIMAQAMASKSSGGSASAIVPLTGVGVDKSTAENGYTVGEIFAKAAGLKAQKVTVKGRVVKL